MHQNGDPAGCITSKLTDYCQYRELKYDFDEGWFEEHRFKNISATEILKENFEFKALL